LRKAGIATALPSSFSERAQAPAAHRDRILLAVIGPNLMALNFSASATVQEACLPPRRSAGAMDVGSITWPRAKPKAIGASGKISLIGFVGAENLCGRQI